MKETDLYAPMKDWFKEKGYEVRPEFGIFYRTFDAIAVKDNIVIAIEMKLCLTRILLDQIRCGYLFADYSYVVISTIPRIESKGLDFCLSRGIGILSIKNEIVKDLYLAKEQKKYLPDYHQRAVEYIKFAKDEGIGGSPNLKGQGPAQAVERMIIDKRELKPDISWKELYTIIPNHYSSYRSMQGAMSMLQQRRAFYGT